MKYSFLFWLFVFSLPSFGQSNPGYYFRGEKNYQLVFGDKNDGLPKKMKVKGVISEVTFVPACGIIAYSGTAKIKLTEKIKNYPFDDVFVGIFCFGEWFGEFGKEEQKYLNQTVEIEVTKINKTNEKEMRYYRLTVNKSDSKGIPFYSISFRSPSIFINSAKAQISDD